jgi:hypothetical protein
MKTYNVTKAMSDLLFKDPKRLEKALRESIKQAKREKQIRKDLNNFSIQ